MKKAQRAEGACTRLPVSDAYISLATAANGHGQGLQTRVRSPPRVGVSARAVPVTPHTPPLRPMDLSRPEHARSRPTELVPAGQRRPAVWSTFSTSSRRAAAQDPASSLCGFRGCG